MYDMLEPHHNGPELEAVIERTRAAIVAAFSGLPKMRAAYRKDTDTLSPRPAVGAQTKEAHHD